MSQAEHDRRIDYIEFPVTKMAETKKFYADLFGWEMTDYGPDYASFDAARLTLEFDLAEHFNGISFQFLFGSEEFSRATDVGFFISIESWDPKFDTDKTRGLLERAGAAHIETVEQPEDA